MDDTVTRGTPILGNLHLEIYGNPAGKWENVQMMGFSMSNLLENTLAIFGFFQCKNVEVDGKKHGFSAHFGMGQKVYDFAPWYVGDKHPTFPSTRVLIHDARSNPTGLHKQFPNASRTFAGCWCEGETAQGWKTRAESLDLHTCCGYGWWSEWPCQVGCLKHENSR